MTGTFLGALGGPWHWHAWHGGWAWPLVGLFWAALWIVMLGLLFSALWRGRGSFPGRGFPGPGPGGGPTGGPAGGTVPGGRFFRTGTPGEPLRASTEEREATVRALSDAMAGGRLSSDEHSERVSAAYAARYRHELAGLTADLPAAEAPRPQGADEATASRPARLAAPLAIPLIVVGLLLATSFMWGFGPPWPLLLLGVWFFVRVSRRARATARR